MRWLVLALVCVAPLMARGEVRMRSGHTADLRVVGDHRDYALVDPSAPLIFAVDGPLELFLLVRQVLAEGQVGGATRTEVVLLQDGYQIRSAGLSYRQGGEWTTPRGDAPSEAHELRVNVPEGTHGYRLAVKSPDHRVAVAISLAADDPDSLELVELAPLPPKAARAGAEAHTEAPVPWSEARGEPEVPGTPAPPMIRAELPPEPARPWLLLGARLTLAAGGAGAGAPGGGLYALYRTPLLEGALAFGVAADLLPSAAAAATLGGETARASVRTAPLMATVLLALPASGPLRWQASAGAGVVVASARTPDREGRAVLPGIALGFGPALRLGPGAITLTAGWTRGFGELLDDSGAPLATGRTQALAFQAGYQLTL